MFANHIAEGMAINRAVLTLSAKRVRARGTGGSEMPLLQPHVRPVLQRVRCWIGKSLMPWENVTVDLQTTLFYEFSTIAQALAGALGLMGAFVLFALQGVEKTLTDAEIRLRDSPYGDDLSKPEIMALAIAGDWQGWLSAYERTKDKCEKQCAPNPLFSPGDERIAADQRLRAAIRQRERLLLGVRQAMWSTAIAIVGSVAILATASLIARCTALSVVVLCAGAGGTLWCVYTYYRVLATSIPIRKGRGGPLARLLSRAAAQLF